MSLETSIKTCLVASTNSEPSPTEDHFSAAVGGELYVIGGFSKKENKLVSCVYTFNQCTETWQNRPTTGTPLPGLYRGACAAMHSNLYVYGGNDGSRQQNSLYKLDTISFKWSQLLSGPTKKDGCRMISYDESLILFGGYGSPIGHTQSGAEFIKDTTRLHSGWTNELHVFNVKEGEMRFALLLCLCSWGDTKLVSVPEGF